MEKKTSNIHIVIPTFNEEEFIGKLLLQLNGFEQITVVDGGSVDDTLLVVQKFSTLVIKSPKKGRAKQMNLGAEECKSEYLLFLHADLSVPNNFKNRVEEFIETEKPTAASFTLTFDSKHKFLKLNAFFSRFNSLPFQFGDQGLLIKRDLFERLGGFDEALLFMEGNDLIRRIKKIKTFKKCNIKLTVSARKYNLYGVYSLQLSYYLIYTLNRVGVSQVLIKQWFRKIF